MPRFPALEGDLQTDVLVIGGGLTGLLCAWDLSCAGVGCALYWNRQERSWDCSCHGSRFAADGTLLNNPANRNKGK